MKIENLNAIMIKCNELNDYEDMLVRIKISRDLNDVGVDFIFTQIKHSPKIDLPVPKEIVDRLLNNLKDYYNVRILDIKKELEEL